MGEGFSGGGDRFRKSSERHEHDPLLEQKIHLDEINQLLAIIVEQGDLSSQQRQYLRAKVRDHLVALGLTSLDQLADFSAKTYNAINDRIKNPQHPSNYPSKKEFAQRLIDVSGKEHGDLPPVFRRLTLSEVALYGRLDRQKIMGRGGVNAIDYLYKLGKLMCDEVAYSMVFKPGDEIKVGKNWNIENGRHRVLTLKTLGEGFVRNSRMGLWVKPQKEN